MPRITPNLWFDQQGQEAAEFYVSVFPSSRITEVLLCSTSADELMTGVKLLPLVLA